MLHGALAASVTPLTRVGATSTRTPSRRSASSSPTVGSTVCWRSGRTVKESCSRSTSAAAACGTSSTPGGAAPGRRPLRRPDDGGHRRVWLRTRPRPGADAVAVIGPPYFPLDERAQLDHFAAAAAGVRPAARSTSTSSRARAGTPSRSPRSRQLRERADNFAGMKVSDSPWEAFEPYTIGRRLDIFVGPEALIHQGLAAGATGAVSALASAFPEEVAAVVREPTRRGCGAARGAARGRRAVPPARRDEADRAHRRGVRSGRRPATAAPARRRRGAGARRAGSTREALRRDRGTAERARCAR